MNTIEAIKTRVSCRTFSNTLLKASDKSELEQFISQNNRGLNGTSLNFEITEKRDDNRVMKLDYGMIQGHTTYILGKTGDDQASRVNYGYMMEKIVLKSTEMGLATCWVGYFDGTFFDQIKLENNEKIPSIMLVGYAEKKQSTIAKIVRFSIRSSKRHEWNKLFFNFTTKESLTDEFDDKYRESLEMTRLAPSAGNVQPLRIFYNNATNEFHFYKKPISMRYEKDGLHDIDMGIAMAHFELTTLQNGLKGNWVKNDSEISNSIDGLQYIMTWKY